MKSNLIEAVLRYVLVAVLFAGLGCCGVFAETVTYTVDSKTSVTTSGTAPSGSSAAYNSTYTTKTQLIEGQHMQLVLSGYAGYKITGLTLYMRSNKEAGAGYLDVKAGNTTLSSIGSSNMGVSFNSTEWYGQYSNNWVSVKIKMNNTSHVIQDGEDVAILIGATENSLYCWKFTITYEKTAPLSFVARSSEGYWATFSSTQNVVIPQKVVIPQNVAVEGTNVAVSAYAVSVSGDDLVLTQLNECLIDGAWHLPANTGCLLNASYGAKGGLTIDYTFEATSKGNVTCDNFLMPGLGATTTGNGCKFYRLAYYDYEAKTGLGFYYGPGCNNGEAFMCKAGTAYLAVPNNVAPNVKSFVFDGSETAVSPVRAGHNGALLYNLNGQRVNGVRRGVYVKSGKKIFVK